VPFLIELIFQLFSQSYLEVIVITGVFFTENSIHQKIVKSFEDGLV